MIDPVELDVIELRAYDGRILNALIVSRMPEEAERGIMHWYDEGDSVDEKVRSVVFTAEERNGQLWGVAECRVVGTLTPEELATLTDYIEGQAADGWGEGLEQREIRVDGGAELYVHLWNSDNWSIMTEAERFDTEHKYGVPIEAQQSGFDGERSRSGVSEPCPQGGASGTELVATMGGMALG